MELLLKKAEKKHDHDVKNKVLKHFDSLYNNYDTNNSIYIVIDNEQQLIHINPIGLKWLGKSCLTQLSYIDLNGLLELHSIKTDQLKQKIYQLRNIWFPIEKCNKSCLITCDRILDSPYVYVNIKPVENWDFLLNRLGKLIEEEEYIKRNKYRFNQLTKREKEVMGLIEKGLNSKEISDLLFVSKHTIEQHRKNINKKLRSGSIAELIKFSYIFNKF